MEAFKIVFGDNNTEIQKRSIEKLSKTIHDAIGVYPPCEKYSDKTTSEENCINIYLGTKANNAYILKNSKSSLTIPESYYIKVDLTAVIIEGYDDAGALYGVIDFYNKYMVKYNYYGPDETAKNFLTTRQKMAEFEYLSAPSIKERGLWTWGHVIYDYKGYLDNMMQLKFNSVIIWNDYVPLNAKEIVEYAHARNIKVIWGFSWLWDTSCKILDMVNTKEKSQESQEIFEKYEREYAGLNADGIYFQTFTELKEETANGVLIADAATKFVNETARLFFSKYPNLRLQFGLHATSVKNRLEFIKNVDNRIEIIWEDCGSMPYSYYPQNVSNFEETKRFTEDIALLRGENDKFGVVTKGLTYLNWQTFKHQVGSQIIGESDKNFIIDRYNKKIPFLKYIQAYWITSADNVYEIIKTIKDKKRGNASVYALVEDGIFDANIYYPVALYSEMLWDANSDIKTLQNQVALRDYVKFV